MGSKASRMNVDPPYGSKRNLQSILSEEGYLPMTRSMRENLLKGRKVQRCIPTRINGNDNLMEQEEAILAKTEYSVENIESKNVVSKDKIEVLGVSTQTQSAFTISNEGSRRVTFGKVTPFVSVVHSVEIDETSKSLPNARMDEEKEITVYSTLSSPRKSHVTNRNYSLIDMRTGLKKSRFTLDLEDRLRKSKLVLGFDTHLSEWKEFSYKVESPKVDVRKSFEKITPDKSKDMKNKHAPLENSNKTVQYCTRNCQILGLCSIGRPQVFPNKNKLEPTIFRNAMQMGDSIYDPTNGHTKKEGCPCDLCMLSYLTDMNCHNGRSVSVKQKSQNSLSNSDKVNRQLKEKIRIIDNNNGKKSIEVSVRSPSPDTQSSFFSNCSNLTTETAADCTNSRIRNMFKDNNSSDVREIYTNPKSTYNDLSIDELLPVSTEHFRSTVLTDKLTKKTTSTRQPLSKHSHRDSCSTLTSNYASSSSLSTILSYKRVRHIFQRIIEGNRSRRRTKLDVHKFKEMEELGLGKFKNNRWYPSEYKAFSIWQDMNENVQGLQGEFKKYQKSTNRN